MAIELKRILYVEDEADIQTVAVTVLEAIGGYTIIACSSGAQAVAAAPGANADLILLDVMMPGMDGPTTLKALRDIPQTAETPVVFMTAKVQTNEIAHFKSLGALDVIRKPFDPVALSEQIGAIWRRRPNADQQAAPRRQGAAAPPPDDALKALYLAYAADVPKNVGEISDLWTRLVRGTDPLALKSLHRALHSGHRVGARAPSERRRRSCGSAPGNIGHDRQVQTIGRYTRPVRMMCGTQNRAIASVRTTFEGAALRRPCANPRQGGVISFGSLTLEHATNCRY
jgi:CheY-like chemotaxis protein